MRKALLVILLVFGMTSVYAFRISKPQIFSLPWTTDQVNQLNDALEDLWNLQNGEFNLDIVETTKTNADNGDFWIYTSNTTDIQYKVNGTIYNTIGQQFSETNYLSVENDGTLVMNGNATVWEDLRVPSQNTKLNPTKSEPAFEEFTDGLYVYKYDTSNADDESVHFVAQMSHGYKEGSDIYPHLHWSPDSTNTGNVRWQFEYIITDIDGTFASSSTTETITEPADGTALKHQMVSFSTIDGTGLTVSHMIICRLTRLSTSDALDTFTGNACFLEFDFHYEKDTIGSRTELAK